MSAGTRRPPWFRDAPLISAASLSVRRRAAMARRSVRHRHRRRPRPAACDSSVEPPLETASDQQHNLVASLHAVVHFNVGASVSGVDDNSTGRCSPRLHHVNNTIQPLHFPSKNIVACCTSITADAPSLAGFWCCYRRLGCLRLAADPAPSVRTSTWHPAPPVGTQVARRPLPARAARPHRLPRPAGPKPAASAAAPVSILRIRSRRPR